MLFETSFPAPVFGLRREMNRLFDDVLTRTMPATAWLPPVDVREDAGELLITVELPGVKPEDVEVTTEGGVLTVRGTKHAERKEGEDERYHLLERTYGTFTRSFRLPKVIDDSKVSAGFENGVLSIHVPKAALPQPRKIAISHRDGAAGQVRGAGSEKRDEVKPGQGAAA